MYTGNPDLEPWLVFYVDTVLHAYTVPKGIKILPKDDPLINVTMEQFEESLIGGKVVVWKGVKIYE